MLVFHRISHIIFIFMMLALFFLSPRQTAASVPGLPTGNMSDQFLVGFHPNALEIADNQGDANKDKERVKTPATGTNVKSNISKKDSRDLNDTATVQEVGRFAEGVSCDLLGMIPDDETKGDYNYNILLSEVKKGIKIHVNGTYYLRSPYDEYSTANEVNEGLYLIGDSPDISKLILKGGSFFNVKGEALIENIYIECPTTRFTYLINMFAPYVNEITIKGCFITGNIRMLNSRIPTDHDFTSEPCYIERLVIENNEFYDIYNSMGAKYIISLTDTPVKLSYIRNNKVTNFSYVFYNNGINNGHPFTQYLIENSNTVIENNIVMCTDDYDAIARNDGYSPMYYCFALIEGFSVQCRNNIFEGFHISNAPDTVVYDNYFSVTKLLYENNTWKNIVNFTPDITCVDIMKSKYATRVAGEKTERTYRGNVYIVEPSYADRFGKDRFLLRKKINTWQTDIDRIIIEDNNFDMYLLSFDCYGQLFKEFYKFNKNTILMDTIEHSINWQALVCIKEMKDESGDFIPRDLIFTNNTITCESEPFGQAIGTKMNSIIYDTTEGGDKTRVDFSNNNIDVPGLEFIRSKNRSYSDILAAVKFKNNTITGIDPQPYLAILPTNQIN